MGCGCDEEGAKKCLEEKSAEATTALSSPDADKLCTLVNGIIACVVDNSCCDKDDLKAQTDQTKKSMETYLKDCDIKSCE